MNANKLSVRLHGKPIGILEKTTLGKLHFSYQNAVTDNLSWSMPIKEKAFDHKYCRAYFGGLLPRDVDSKDIFSLLHKMGKECIGAVSFHDISEEVYYEPIALNTRL